MAPDREVTTSVDGQENGEGISTFAMRRRAIASRCRCFVRVMFYLGDVHASQGDTEFTGTAAETKSTVRLKLDVIKQKRIPWMRSQKPDAIVSVHAFRPLEVAVETPTVNLMDWLITDYGFSPTDAYCFVSTCPGFSHQRLSDVQARQVELRGRGRGAEAVFKVKAARGK